MPTDDSNGPDDAPEPAPGPAPDAGGPPSESGGTGVIARIGRLASNPSNRFVVLFLVYLGVLAYFYPKAALRYSDVMDWMAEVTAAANYHLFGAFSDHISLKGTMVTFGGFAVQIIEECTGLYEVLIFVAAVLAFPTTLVKKGIGILGGAPILYGVNVLRIGFLLVVGRFYPDTFDFMHLYFWQATLILMITSVWLLWIFKVVRHEGPAHAD